MAFMRLGSKSEIFHREGQTWHCTTGLPSDVTFEVGETSFNLHKFPLISRSGLLEKLIEENSSVDGSGSVLNLSNIPGGGKSFELTIKFCYGVKIELTSLNVVRLRCAAEYLQMTDNYGEGNLVAQTEALLNELFGNWTNSIKVLQTCEEVLPYAEELHIVSRCIDSLATKACADPYLFNWPVSGRSNAQSPEDKALWNGISTATKPQPTGDDWWYDDASVLSLPLYKRLILAVELRGLKPESIAAALMCYAKRHIPVVNRQSNLDEANRVKPLTSISTPPEADQRVYLEEIVQLLPGKKGVTSTKFLLRLLRTAMVLHASPACRENLERRVGIQLDQASLVDLLIPNMGYSETLYDIDCVQRILNHFMSVQQAASISPSLSITEEAQVMNGPESLTPMTMVATLMDGYLAEVAPDVNLKLPKFEALASVIPDYARPIDDGIYHAVDVYLKAHPQITDIEREHICRLMNCQKLSLDASTHAAQNERLPLRLIVQVLFFEQLRLRTSVSGWFFVSENLDNSQIHGGNCELLKHEGAHQDQVVVIDEVKERVSELEKECLSMKQELQKLVRTKKSWKDFTKKLYFRKKSERCNPKESNSCNRKAQSSVNAQ